MPDRHRLCIIWEHQGVSHIYTAFFAKTTFKLLTKALFNDGFPFAEVPDAVPRKHGLKAVRRSPPYPLESCAARNFFGRNNIPEARVSGFDTSVGRVRSERRRRGLFCAISNGKVVTTLLGRLLETFVFDSEVSIG